MPDKLLTGLRPAWLQNTFPEEHKGLVCPHRREDVPQDTLPLGSGQRGDKTAQTVEA